MSIAIRGARCHRLVSGDELIEQYNIGKQYALKTVTLYLNAITKVFQINVGGVQLDSQPIKGLHHQIMDFDEYATLMIEEARAIARKQRWEVISQLVL